MDFTPKPSTIGEIFQSEYFFNIPKYQRKYVWRNSNIEDLWNDIQFSIREKEKVNYFLGSFIFKSTKNNKFKIVVDGQQRLTSLLVLNSIICKKFKDYEDNFNKDEMLKYCVLGDKDEKVQKPRVINDELILINYMVDYCCFEEFPNSFEDYLLSKEYKICKNDKQLIYCYNYYTEQINEKLNLLKGHKTKIKYLEQLRDSILKISTIEISVEDEQSASLVFETINARGQELETHEILKNYLFMYEKPIRGAYSAKNKWDSIILNVDNGKNTSLPKFISQYCTFVFGKARRGEIFKKFKYGTPRDKVNERINHLLDSSEIYKNIICCNDDHYSKKLNYLLSCFSEMGISIIRPLLMSLLWALKRNDITEDKLCKYLVKIKNFFSIFVCICEKKTNELEDQIYEYSYKLNKEFAEDILENLIAYFESKKPEYNVFLGNFSTFSFSKYPDKYENVKINKQKCKYILKEYELYLQQNDDFVISSFSIEHVKDDCNGGKACLIGNLIPLPKKKNNNLSGKSMNEKVKIYEKSCYMSTQKISKHASILTWNDENIQSRTNFMAKEFYEKIWKI